MKNQPRFSGLLKSQKRSANFHKCCRKFLTLSLLLLFSAMMPAGSAMAQTGLDNNLLNTGNAVRAICSDETYTYVGGDFTDFGAYLTFSGAKLTTTSFTPEAGFPIITGTISAVAPDGSGGWYVGGNFIKVGDLSINRLAHIKADKTVDTWNPNVGGQVYAIAVSGNDIYVGGSFTTAGGTTRNRLAKFTTSSNTPDATWNPNASGIVYAIAISGSDIYVGGEFTSVQSQTRSHVAKLNNTTGAPVAGWSPSVSTDVYAIAVDASNNVYIGGTITNVGSTIRSLIAKVKSDGTLDSWNVRLLGDKVNSIVLNGSDVYAGGKFTSAWSSVTSSFITRNNLAKFNNTDGTLIETWNPNATASNAAEVKAMVVGGSNIFVGGTITAIGSTVRNRLAKLNMTDGSADATWDPSVNNTVYAIAISGADIYAGGVFTILGAKTRNRLARFNKSTGLLDETWNPDASGSVRAIAVSGTDIFVGGQFLTIGGVIRKYFAKLDYTTGAVVTGFNADITTANGYVNSIAVEGDYVYIGGAFTTFASTITRNYLARVNRSDGSANSDWNPNMGNAVNSLVISGSNIYVGGTFTTVNGTTTRNRLAKFTTSSAVAQSWNPNANAEVKAIAVKGSSVYVGGSFTSVGGKTRSYLAKLDDATGTADNTWNPGVSVSGTPAVNAIALTGNYVYVGGYFTTIGGQSRAHFARLNNTNGNADAWSLDLAHATTNPALYAIDMTGSLFIGGLFTSIGGTSRTNIARYFDCSDPAIGGTIGLNQTITTGNVPAGFDSKGIIGGYMGSPEYQWQSSTTSSSTGFTDLTGATSTSYSAGILTQDTWFRRLARVSCSTDWTNAAASNAVKITVTSLPLTVNFPAKSGSWAETRPGGDTDQPWISFSVSGDGSTVLGSALNGGFYSSVDYGINYTNKGTNYWTSSKVSSDGSTKLAAIYFGYSLKYITGDTAWSSALSPGHFLSSAAVSTNGYSMLLGGAQGKLHRSINQGLTWTEMQPAGAVTRDWLSVSVSGDGSKMLAAATGKRIYRSTNGGDSWAEIQPAGAFDKKWSTTAISADGNRMIAGVDSGRLYLSNNGGTNWSEVHPAGAMDKRWSSVAISPDGAKILAAVNGGRVYQSTNGGVNWSEIQPAGNVDKGWATVAMSDDTATLIAAVSNGRAYKTTRVPIVATNITAINATGNGKIEKLNGGGNATNRGVIWYPYTDTDKTIGDAGVTNVAEDGTFTSGSFTASFTGLSTNTRYNARAYATNSKGTSYSPRGDFWTLANIPAAPTVNNPTISTLDVAINTNGNPDDTTYVIHDSLTGKFVQANGSLGTDTVWKTAVEWGIKTVIGLTDGTRYTFEVKARNGGNVETAYGPGASGVTDALPKVLTEGAIGWAKIFPYGGTTNKRYDAVALSDNGMIGLAGIYGTASSFTGYLYKTTDGGVSWTMLNPTGTTPVESQNWKCAAVSASGDTMLAAVYSGRIYRSFDAGSSWSEINPYGGTATNKAWLSVAMSSNGQTMLATTTASGKLFRSHDAGNTWTDLTNTISGVNYIEWRSIAVSADGNTMIVANSTKLYISIDRGITWVRKNPSGLNQDRFWGTVSISEDGMKMLAGIESSTNGRLYYSGDRGETWSETLPNGDDNFTWSASSINGDGTALAAGYYGSKMYLSSDGINWTAVPTTSISGAPQWKRFAMSYKGTRMLAGGTLELYLAAPQSVTSITATSATVYGNITSLNNATATNRGHIVYPYNNTDKIIGDAGVTNVSENGTFTTGVYTSSLASLTPATHYNFRAHATNSLGTGYGDRADFWTLANVPSAPTVTNATATTLDVIINPNGNPSVTEFIINETSTGKYIQANGILDTTKVWQSGSTWDTITVTGLTTGTTYTFKVKARNGNNVETAYGSTSNGTPQTKPSVGFQRTGSTWSETQPHGASDRTWQAVAVSYDGSIMLASTNSSLKLSKDGGASWTSIKPEGPIAQSPDWKAVSVSSDGSVMLAGAGNGRLYKSVNGGTTWDEAMPEGPQDKNWKAVSVSADGNTMLAAIFNGRLYKSTNAGASWIFTGPFGTTAANWTSVSVSGDGSKMSASVDGGRLYCSTNGGTNWTETRPNGDINKTWAAAVSSDGKTMIAAGYGEKVYASDNNGTSWSLLTVGSNVIQNYKSVSLSADGETMFACVFNGRLYSSIDKGVTWNEQQPAGAVNQSWIPISVSADGTTVLSGVFGGRLYKMKTAETIATNITATTATGNGTIINLNGGGNATNRGIIFYPYIGSDKIIGDANVTNVSTNGSYGTGAFTASLTGLSPDSRYNIRAHATNNAGTGYSARRSFRTLANVPSAPTVLNPTATSLDVVINANGNPDSTTFVIYETSLEKFVKANGALDTVEIWQKAATWDTVTVTGLTAGVSYTFKVKARNGEKVETAYGDSVSGMPRSIPTVTTQFVSSITDTTATGNGNITATNGADPTIRGLIYYPYTDTDKEIGQTGVTNVADTGTYSTGTFTQDFTGLSVNKRYNVRVHAKNIVGISYGARVDFWTLANVPDPPTVINPAATSLDVAVNVNGNPANTEFAIQDSVNDVYVQGNGTLAATAVWQTASVWDTITVSGLTAGTTYYFRVKARNADSVETDFSLTTARNTCSNPVNGGTIGVAQQICYGSLAETLDNIAHASEYGGTLEYKWQKSTVSDTAGYADIPGAADSIFVPGTLTDTTWFRRLSKVTCKADWTDATPSNVVKITVDPLTIAGSISGDTLVCYGSHSSELILGGYTGVVQKWQYSADQLAWSNIDSSAAPTYTSVNLTAERWYRTVVQSGVCAADTSDAHYINVFADYKISGVARYENNPKTLLSNLKITLKKNGSQVGTPVITGASGAYQFTGLTNGTYSLEVASAHPSGQWQTWGGVNNTDALLVSNHIAGTTPLAVNPPVIRVTASTKVPHPQIANNDYLAIRQAAKYPTTGFSYFDLPKWVFTGTTTTSRIDTFELACANVTRDVRGLCAGDVNGSYVPGTGYKTVEPGLALANQGTLPLTNEIVFPIRLGRGTDIGAITLFMDFNPKLIEITGVEMPENNGVEPWFEVNGGTLYIGWMSTNPISIRDNEPLILVHAHVQTHGNVATHSIASIPTQTIRFTLNDNTISELADADGNVIDRIKLFIPDANGNNDLAKWRNIELVIYPNPTKSTLNIDLQSFNPEPSELTIELVNIHGVTVMQPQPETIVSGWHHLKMDVSDLAPGVYFLKAKVGDEVQMKKIIISR